MAMIPLVGRDNPHLQSGGVFLKIEGETETLTTPQANPMSGGHGRVVPRRFAHLQKAIWDSYQIFEKLLLEGLRGRKKGRPAATIGITSNWQSGRVI